MKLPTVSFVKSRAAFVFLPLLYVFLCLFFFLNTHKFYMGGHDPVYPYLMNAVNLAGGHMELGMIDHPGTPVELFGGAVLFVSHLFTGHSAVYEDVLRNPEHYLAILVASLIAVLALVTFFTGVYVFRKTGNLALALFFQLIPMLGRDMLQHAIFLKPESFIIIINTFFTAYLYVTVLSPENTPFSKLKTRNLLVMAFFSGMLIATKVICAPFVVLLVFLLKGFKQFLLFGFATVVSFALCITPALPKYKIMWSWLKALTSHDGHYGQGNKQIINPIEFVSNMGRVFSGDWVFTITYVLLTVTALFSLVRLFRKQTENKIVARFAIGLWLSISFLILLVAKHFSFHYLIPAYVYIPLTVLVILKAFPYFQQWRFYARYRQALPLALVAVFTCVLFIREEKNVFLYPHNRNPMLNTEAFMSSWEGIPVITINEERSAFIGPAIWFGIIYAGDLRNDYFQFIKPFYENWYFYRPESRKLTFWDEDMLIKEVFRKNRKVLVYFIGRPPEEEAAVLNDLTHPDAGKTLASQRQLFNNPETRENIYLLEADTLQLGKQPEAYFHVASDLEKLSDDGLAFSSTNTSFVFQKAAQVTREAHRSGKNSILLNTQDPYGLDLQFEVKPGDIVQATIWRKASDHNGCIILSAKDQAHLYKSGAVTIKKEGEWDQIQCKAIIPDNFPEKTITMYLYYVGKEEVYFDDVEVTLFHKE